MSDSVYSVEEAIRTCNMEAYADAIVGGVGEGLSVEQRKICVNECFQFIFSYD